MNKSSIIISITCLAGFATLASAGCSQPEKTADATAKSAQTRTPTTVTATQSPETARQTVPASMAAAVVQWSDVSDAGFALRDQTLTKMSKLQARVDDQVKELIARRAQLTPTVDTAAWDLAMKEMDSSRTGLQSSIDVLGKATRETWDQEKDKVGIAWTRTQNAYAKVLASTTTGTTVTIR